VRFSRTTYLGLALLGILTLSLALSGLTRLTTHAKATTASIALSTVTGPPTTVITVTGSGFGSSETVKVSFDTVTLSNTTTSSTGGFSQNIAVPTSALPGKHTIQAIGRNSGMIGSRSFLVNTNWRTLGYDEGHSGTNPYENVLSPTTVSKLVLDWHSPIGSGPSALSV